MKINIKKITNEDLLGEYISANNSANVNDYNEKSMNRVRRIEKELLKRMVPTIEYRDRMIASNY